MFPGITFMGMDIPTIVLIVLIYSFIGWFYESTIFSLAEQGKIMNRGCFVGPYCPIYGVVCILCVYLLRDIQSPGKLILISGLIVSAVEYVTSVILEKLFHARYWDYSYFPLNINGRVSLFSGIFFGLAITFMIKILHPACLSLIDKMPYGAKNGVAIGVLIVFFSDAVFTTIAMCNLNRKCKELYDAWDRYVEKGLDKINSKKDGLDRFIVVEKGKKIVVKLKGVNKKFVDLETKYIKSIPSFTSTKYSTVMNKIKKSIRIKGRDVILDEYEEDFEEELEKLSEQINNKELVEDNETTINEHTNSEPKEETAVKWDSKKIIIEPKKKKKK